MEKNHLADYRCFGNHYDSDRASGQKVESDDDLNIFKKQPHDIKAELTKQILSSNHPQRSSQ